MSLCQGALQLCRTRVTRLNDDGSPASGPNNVYVTDKALSIQVKPQVEAGADRTLVGGCDCIVLQYRGRDKLKYFGLQLDLSVMEPELMEMLLGATAIIEGGQVAGNWWPGQNSCSSPVQPAVCLEGWQKAWVDDHAAANPVQYIHWIWPHTRWQISDHTLQNDFLNPQLNGYTVGNPNWGVGIFGDLPAAAQPNGGWFFTNALPAALCGYQSRPIT